jgi:hypothetical protein
MNTSVFPGHLRPNDLFLLFDDRSTGIPAAVGNAAILSARMACPSLCWIETAFLSVASDCGYRKDFPVEAGLYSLAIMVKWIIFGAVICRGEYPMSPGSGTLRVDERNRDDVLEFVERFMGEKICREARDTENEHRFLTVLLRQLDNGIDFELTVLMKSATERR